MSKKEQVAAIQKWFSYIKDGDKRRDEISKAKENIDLGIITYSEWVKATLLMNRTKPANDNKAAIDLLSTLSEKIKGQICKKPEKSDAIVDALLMYYVGKHDKADAKIFYSDSKTIKPSKKKMEKGKGIVSKFFGNW